MMRFICCFFVVYGASAFSLVAGEELLRDGKYAVEEDMLLSKANSMERNAVSSDSRLWPDGVVVYEIDQKLMAFKGLIKKAMKHYEDQTCIRFKERTNERYYLRIRRSKTHPFSCFADVGYYQGEMFMSLGTTCTLFGVILHELGHVIGFYHEHNRVDRDEYLTINFDNVPKAHRKYLEKLKPSGTRTIGPFDYDSIMMYSYYTYSKAPGVLLVMKPKQKGVFLRHVAQKGKLSDWDVKKINTLYKCDEKTR